MIYKKENETNSRGKTHTHTHTPHIAGLCESRNKKMKENEKMELR